MALHIKLRGLRGGVNTWNLNMHMLKGSAAQTVRRALQGGLLAVRRPLCLDYNCNTYEDFNMHRQGLHHISCLYSTSHALYATTVFLRSPGMLDPAETIRMPSRASSLIVDSSSCLPVPMGHGIAGSVASHRAVATLADVADADGQSESWNDADKYRNVALLPYEDVNIAMRLIWEHVEDWAMPDKPIEMDAWGTATETSSYMSAAAITAHTAGCFNGESSGARRRVRSAPLTT